MKTGSFEDVVYLQDDTELAVMVEWDAVDDRGDAWTPPHSEMNYEVTPLGEWPEGLSQQAFDAAVASADYRLTDRVWRELRDAD